MPRSPVALAIATAFPFAVTAQVPSLPAVQISAQKETYLEREVSVVQRDAVPLEQVPQSVIVIGRKLLDDQDARTIQDAVRNVSNVRSPDPRDQYNTQYRIRGFSAATLVDGVAMPSTFSNLETAAAVERLEVIKGPGTVLNSAGQAAGALGFVGGALAITTRSPEMSPMRSIGARLGSYGERGVFLDLNQPVNESLALRLVAERNRTRSITDGVYFDRTSVFPSLSLRPSATSELLVKLRSSRQSTVDYSGLPPEGSIVPAAWTVPRSLNVTAIGQPPSGNDVDSATVRWRQSWRQGWSWEATAYTLTSKLDQNGVFTDDFFAVNPGPVYFLSGLNLTQRVRTTGLSTTVRGVVTGAGVTHHVSAGIDLDRTTDYGFMAFAGGFPGALGAWDIRAPGAVGWVAPVPNLAGAQDNRYRSTSVFLQDRIALGPRLHVTAAVRHTRIKVANTWPDFGVDSNTENSATAPRLGATYQFTSGLSAFAGYGESISIPTNGIYSTPPRPERAQQAEVGVRLAGLAGVQATIAWFDLARRNVPVSDPANIGRSIQSGEQRSSGVDMDVTWRPSRDWTFLGHHTRQNPRLTKDTTLPVGNQLFNTFRSATRLAVRYELPSGPARGLGVGLGASRQAGMPLNIANTLFTAGYTVWDAQVSYTRDGVRYQAAVRNLTDRQFYEPAAYFNGPHVIPGLGRQLSLSASYTF